MRTAVLTFLSNSTDFSNLQHYGSWPDSSGCLSLMNTADSFKHNSLFFSPFCPVSWSQASSDPALHPHSCQADTSAGQLPPAITGTRHLLPITKWISKAIRKRIIKLTQSQIPPEVLSIPSTAAARRAGNTGRRQAANVAPGHIWAGAGAGRS